MICQHVSGVWFPDLCPPPASFEDSQEGADAGWCLGCEKMFLVNLTRNQSIYMV